MPFSMAETFVEEALANLEGDVGDERHGRFLRGTDALIKRAERRAEGAVITFQDGSMATLNTQEQGLTFEMAVHHSSGSRAFAWGQRTYSPLPPDLDDEWARALPQGRNGLRTAEYLAGLAGPKQREGEALKRAGTETGYRADHRRRLLRTRRFARAVVLASAPAAAAAALDIVLFARSGESFLHPMMDMILAVAGLGLLVTALTSLWETGRTIRRLDERPKEP